MVIILSIDKYIESWLKISNINQVDGNYKLLAIKDFIHLHLKTDFFYLVTNYDYTEVRGIFSFIMGEVDISPPNKQLEGEWCEMSSVLYNAEKHSIDTIFQFLSIQSNELDPDMPMIELYSDRWEHLFISDDENDVQIGERMNIRTIILCLDRLEYPRKSLTIEEITNYIILTKIVNNVGFDMWSCAIKNYDHYNREPTIEN